MKIEKGMTVRSKDNYLFEVIQVNNSYVTLFNADMTERICMTQIFWNKYTFVPKPVEMTIDEFRHLVVANYTNQRREDKSSLIYAMKHINHKAYFYMYLEGYSRKELNEMFFNEVNADTNDSLLKLLEFQTYRHIIIKS